MKATAITIAGFAVSASGSLMGGAWSNDGNVGAGFMVGADSNYGPGGADANFGSDANANFFTSTVYATNVHTITSCGPEVTDCPAHSTVATTVIVAVSTTLCPIEQASKQTEAAPVATPLTSIPNVIVVPSSSQAPAVEQPTVTPVAIQPVSETPTTIQSIPMETTNNSPESSLEPSEVSIPATNVPNNEIGTITPPSKTTGAQQAIVTAGAAAQRAGGALVAAVAVAAALL